MPTDASSMSEPILQVADLHKSFQGNHVLRGLAFELPRSTATALIGSNGAGKSTFLNILSGLLAADRGTISLKGSELTPLPGYLRARAGLGRTFQHPRSFRSLTVLEAVLLAQTPPHAEGIGRNLLGTLWHVSQYDEAALARAQNCLEKCRLTHRAQVAAVELTYGEQKLLMLAQTLAFGGDLFCLDELCAGLEPALVAHIGQLVVDLVREGKTVLFVEHNLQLVRDIGDRTVFLHEGAVFRQGLTSDVLADPDVVRLYLGD
jgi:ABC-type branched-subunit amino acid transport system ATPase component